MYCMEGDLSLMPVLPILALFESLEDNFTLAVIVFIIGFLATLATLIFIVAAHRYWERKDLQEAGDASGEESRL